MTPQEIEQFKQLRGIAPSQIELVQLLCDGAMSELWIATHEAVDFQFVVKYAKATAHDNTYLWGQFERECEASTALMENGLAAQTAAVIDFGIDEVDHPYVFVEYVHGTELGELMGKVCAWEDVRRLLLKISDVLSAIHSIGLVHRDVKPSNILIDPRGDIRLIDFALATIDGNWHRFHPQGLAIGTPLYMSPEQAYGRRDMLTSASDWYAMGIIVYEWMSGEVPFRGATAQETLRLQCFAPPPSPINRHIIGASPQLPALCQALLSKEPNARLSAVRRWKAFLRTT